MTFPSVPLSLARLPLPHAARRWSLAISCVALSVLGSACVNTQQSAPLVTPQRAVGNVSDLHASVRVISDVTDSTLGRRYSAALRWAGVEVVSAVGEADVVSELRQTTHRSNDGLWTEISLVVRGGKEQLAEARLRYPAGQDLSNADLGTLTSALTQSPRVQAYADRVAVHKANTARASDETAWRNAKAADCAQSSSFFDCSDVIRYLNGFPRGEHRDEAETALLEAERVRERASRDAAIERVKREIAAWSNAGVESCRAPTDPSHCDGITAYLSAYPSGRFAGEARQLLTDAETAANDLRQRSAPKGELGRRRAESATAQREARNGGLQDARRTNNRGSLEF